MIKTILIFLALSSNVFAFGLLNQMDAGSTPSAGTCDCEENVSSYSAAMNNAMQSDTYSYSQGFTAPADGTNVVVKFRTRTVEADLATPSFRVYVDDDRNFADAPFGSATGNLLGSEDNTEKCVVVTSGTSLSVGGQYYILIASLDSDTNMYIAEGAAYAGANNTACGKSNSIDHSSGASCDNATLGEDIYFSVCVGVGCSCD